MLNNKFDDFKAALNIPLLLDKMNGEIEFSEEYLENMLDAPAEYVEPEILGFFVWIMSEIERKDLSKEEIEYYISEDIIYN